MTTLFGVLRHSAAALMALAVAAVPDGSRSGRSGTAETTIVIGQVTDSATGSPLASAAVTVVGRTNVYATTAADGRFTLPVSRTAPRERVSLLARRIGYHAVTVATVLEGDTVQVNVSLASSAWTLDAVVTTGAASSADRVQMRSTPANAAMQLQGRIAGAPAPVMGQGRRDGRFDTEAYDHISENPFRSPSVAPRSTFSLDVDRASYSNVRRFIDQGRLPPKDAVRIEELVNYFPFSDVKEPNGRTPLSIFTEVSAAPWNATHDLVRIALRARDVDMRRAPASNLVFLVDVSGSMQGPGRLPLVKQSLALLVNQLREEDRVAIVVYAGQAGLVLPSTSGEDKQKILAALDGLEAGGSTAGGAGIRLAYDVARQHFARGGNNRVILCTDGDFNVGQSSDGALVDLIEQRRKEGSFLTILGFGMGNYKDSKMEKLAGAGNGNYGYIDDLLEARKMLVKEMGGTLLTVAKDVKLQVEFNPAQLHAYRLVGYEDRLLRDEDFTADAKDVGDIGAGHTVTALYEIVRTGTEIDVKVPGVPPLRYQTSTSARRPSDELLHVAMRWKQPDSDRSDEVTVPVLSRRTSPSESMRFASAVAGFGMLLRDSPYVGTLTWQDMLALARGARGSDADGYRAEFIRVGEAAAMLARRTADRHH